MEPKAASNKYLLYIIYVLILGLVVSFAVIGFFIFSSKDDDKEDSKDNAETETQVEDDTTGTEDSSADDDTDADDTGDSKTGTGKLQIDPNAKIDADLIQPISNWTIGSKDLKEETDAYIIDIQYPVIAGYSDDQSQGNFNEMILSSVNSSANSIKNSDIPNNSSSKYSVYSSFDVTYSSNDIASIIMNFSFYYGGAHPGSVFYTLTYDLKNNKELTLADLFNTPDYLTTVAALSKDILVARGITDDGCWVTSGTEATDVNYPNFNISSTGLIITFDEYQVCSYAMGPQTVEIPYADIQAIMESDIKDRVIE